jgi:hypothetical protein
VHALVAAAKGDVPTKEELASLAAALPFAVGGGGGGASGGGAAAKAAAKAGLLGGVKLGVGAVIAVKVTSVLVTGVSLGLASVIVYPPEPWGSDTSAVARTPAATTTSTVTTTPTSSPIAPAAPPAPSASKTPLALRIEAPAPGAIASGPSAGSESEVQLLETAQEALRDNDPDDALALAAKHARRFPNGFLAQEREVIAIEALVRKDRTAEARVRAAEFARKYPRSAHQPRIDGLLSGAGNQNP